MSTTMPRSNVAPVVAEARGATVSGTVTHEFAPFAEAALSNLTTGSETGFRAAVLRHGEVLADVYGGYTDKEQQLPYSADTLQVVFSAGKGILGLLLALLRDRGLLDYALPVANYIPEFAANGKAHITVEELLNHTAGLPVFDVATSADDLLAWGDRVEQLARQRPHWTAGTRHGYHALTIGYLAGELIHRITGLMPGEFLAREITGPAGIEAWFGVPAHEQHRVVRHVDSGVTSETAEALETHRRHAPYYARVDNPPLDLSTLDTPSIWAADIPAISMVTNARALAECYDIAVSRADHLVGHHTLRSIIAKSVEGHDEILRDQPTRFAGLFMLDSSREPLLGPTSFGHNGLAGAIGFTDLDSGTSFAYVGSRFEGAPTPHARVTRLLAALRRCL
jgi:CubicO group peptidase (beta-lactamase class C family)